jgi:hypothetical protein
MARQVSLAVALLTAAAWLLWAEHAGGGGRVVLATAALWWAAALQATWRVWLPAVVVLAGLYAAIPPTPAKMRDEAWDEAGNGSPLRHPRRSLRAVPPATVSPVPPAPLPYTPEGLGEGRAVGTVDTGRRVEPPLWDTRTGTHPPSGLGAEDAGDDDRPAPRALAVRTVPAETGVTAKRERSAAVRRAGGGWQARRDAQAAQVLAAFRELGAGAEGGYVDKAAVGRRLGLATKTVDNRCSDLRKAGLLENPEPGKWRAVTAEAEQVPA